MKEKDIIKNIKDPFLYKKDYLEIRSLSEDYFQIKTKNKKIKFKKNTKIKIISDYTSNFLSECLPIFLANKNINSNIKQKEFGSLNFLSKDLKNPFWKKKTDFFIFMPSSKNLNLPIISDKINTIKKKAKRDAENWLKLWSNIKKNIVQTTFEPTINPNYGGVDGTKYGGYHHYVRLVNSLLCEKKPSNVCLIDIENLVFRNPNTNWTDSRMFNLTKQPFSMETIPILSNHISNAVSGMLGMSKKVIVVDLDNTVWGGIIGDDGYDNIIIGPDTAAGEAFQNFQIYLKNLTQKGIILCVCSKNDEKIAKDAFLKNRNMILKLEDITVFKSNYLDKPTNIRNISSILNLGLDSFVFVDDSKFECEMVKKDLPEVMTINLNDDPSDFIKLVDETSAFYFNNITKEDIFRTSNYKKIAIFNNEIKKTKNINEYLKSLKSRAILEKINNKNNERSSVLLAKTNQFKLNSELFSSRELISKNAFCIFYKDKFQDYGNIGVIIYKIIKNQNLLIENWVLSCRVFSRRLEHFIIKHLLTKAINDNCKHLVFKFEKTKKNIYLQEFLRILKIKIKKKVNIYKIDINQIKLNDLENYIK